MLRAFTFPFEQVRVLIVGQDPYPTPGHAVGLSFSVAPGVRPLPRSLENIFAEYVDDLGYPTPSSGDLSPWAQRGVMLLNRVLTVQPGNPASHRGKGWEMVTEHAIRALGIASSRWWRFCGAVTPPRSSQSWRRRLRRDRVGASLAAVGVSRFLRFTAVQPGQRAAGEDGAEPVDWRLP
ncbi:uracil DNA glycosylase superfamily protein [Mycobacterium xenopi 4042]|uniref:uracil-DNA glycosylase n=1 Tax=Mycobacterium xenopi 4042 TaxID=1299334 RepID=X8E9D5_MYCXE|nr:uracil DNA glycosylase superfamily protein [Mycobacterium xenopi 4042]